MENLKEKLFEGCVVKFENLFYLIYTNGMFVGNSIATSLKDYYNNDLTCQLFNDESVVGIYRLLLPVHLSALYHEDYYGYEKDEILETIWERDEQ